jgi:hypothetical protein
MKTGGPGVEVASFAWRVALNFSHEPLFAGVGKYDILGERLPFIVNMIIEREYAAMDVRGTYSSNPLNCSIGTFEVLSS